MSTEAFLSASWYRIATLRPKLKSQARIRRHRYRGEVWYVVQDAASGRLNRFPPATYQVFGLMDGTRSMEEVWQAAVEQLGDDAPSQDEVIRLLSQLHSADLLQSEVSPDIAELFDRRGRQRRMRQKSNWRNPFSVRIPLWDPDRFLYRSMPAVAPFLGWAGGVVYLVIVGAALASAGVYWPELTENVSDRVLAAHNLILLWLCFPIVKFLHELGHAYATKAGGGEVHEMGILLLVFMPVPYVDATAAGGFRSKWRRAIVGAAGMLTELFIAAVCMFVWLAAEPGLTRAVAFDVVFIAGISTIVFNANPLLRYDGYYILSDLIEIPNLATRGNQYWRYLAERYLFKVTQAEPPPMAPGERAWFMFYPPAAFVYRMLVMIAIVLFVASEWFFIGVLLAIWGVVMTFIWPLLKFGGYLLTSPRLTRTRQRATLVSAFSLVIVLAFLCLVPIAHRIQAEGVVWLPEEANVRAGADGFVREVLVPAGTPVAEGTALIESYDPLLAMQLDVVVARVAELEAKLDMQRFSEKVQAELTRQELTRENAHYERLLERTERLVARSGVGGTFTIDRPDDLPGRSVRKGQLMGYITHDARSVVRAVVSQDDVDLVRNGLVRAEVRLAERLDVIYPAAVVREVPMAQQQLPSAALSTEGGGTIAADPRDNKGSKALSSTFQFDLELPLSTRHATFGGRAHVRFALPPEPLMQQAYRRIRQAFLARFDV